MELNRENFRAMIYYELSMWINSTTTDQLASTFGDKAPHRTTVFRWFAKFNRGRRSLKDEIHKGRPKSVVLPENIDAVREMIRLDRHVTDKYYIFVAKLKKQPSYSWIPSSDKNSNSLS